MIRGAGTGLLFVLLCGTGCSAAADTASGPPPGHVARILSSTAKDEIVLTRLDGSGRRAVTIPVTRGRAEAASAITWSDDGQRLAFGLATRSSRSVYVLDLRTMRLQRIPLPPRIAGGNQELRLSPDGRRLAFVWASWDDSACLPDEASELGLYVVDVTGAGLHRLDALPQALLPRRGAAVHLRELRWSSDSTRLAFVRAENEPDDCRLNWEETSHLISIRPDGRGRRVLAVQNGAAILDVEWAPDGRRLAYSPMCLRASPDTCDVWTVTASGGQPGPFARFEAPGTHPQCGCASIEWSPSGDQLYALAPIDGERIGLHAVRADGGGKRLLTMGGGSQTIAVSSDGRRVLIGSLRVVSDSGKTLWRGRPWNPPRGVVVVESGARLE